MTRPLEGIRVLDLSRVLSGPHCGRMLADLGADVIKLEAPEGDVSRTAQPRIAGISVYYWQQNVGKRNVSIDLHQPKGAEIALELAAACDVVLENYRPGALERVGLGYEQVRAKNPSVVYCSITGYGRQGRASERRAYAPTLHAEIGLMEYTARKHGTDPRGETISHADVYSGIEATAGILTALFHRERTGEGSHVQISMADTLFMVNEWTAIELAGGDGGLPHIFGGFYAPVLQMGDGTWICVPGNPVASFPAWARAMERPDLIEDERFATAESRQKHQAEMMEVLREWVSGFTDFEVLEKTLGSQRIAVGAMRSLADAADSDWVKESGSIANLPDRAGGTIRLPQAPIRMPGLDIGANGEAAYRGEHNREVLTEVLGMKPSEIDSLENQGVISSRLPDEPPKPD